MGCVLGDGSTVLLGCTFLRISAGFGLFFMVGLGFGLFGWFIWVTTRLRELKS